MGRAARKVAEENVHGDAGVMAWLFDQGPERKKAETSGRRMHEEMIRERTYVNRHTAGRSWGPT